MKIKQAELKVDLSSWMLIRIPWGWSGITPQKFDMELPMEPENDDLRDHWEFHVKFSYKHLIISARSNSCIIRSPAETITAAGQVFESFPRIFQTSWRTGNKNAKFTKNISQDIMISIRFPNIVPTLAFPKLQMEIKWTIGWGSRACSRDVGKILEWEVDCISGRSNVGVDPFTQKEV